MTESASEFTAARPRSGRMSSGAWSLDRDVGSAASFLLVRNSEGQIAGITFGELSDGFSGPLLIAQSSDWGMSEVDQRFNEAIAGDREPVQRADMADGSAEWRALGDALGFDGLLDDLAVIGLDLGRRQQDDGHLVQQTRSVAEGLRSAGYQHAAIAVVAAGLPLEVKREIFQVGAQVLEVPDGFYDLGSGGRRSALRSLFPLMDPGLPPPAPASQRQDADPRQYAERNPDLQAGDVTAWWRRLAAPLGEE